MKIENFLQECVRVFEESTGAPKILQSIKFFWHVTYKAPAGCAPTRVSFMLLLIDLCFFFLVPLILNFCFYTYFLVVDVTVAFFLKEVMLTVMYIWSFLEIVLKYNNLFIYLDSVLSVFMTVDVFEDASPMVTSVLDGYNVCIFAYGQTGTGKTFTMEGTELNRGVNYRTLEQLFKVAEERKDTYTYKISVSVLEVYNEQIRDLLATSSTSKK